MSAPVTIDPTPRFRLSPYLYMQFAEPLGNADSSIDAAWDYLRQRWQPKTVEILRKLAPPMIRWGGCFASYYHWREAVGPRSQRTPVLNLCWDGLFSNQVGTCELAELARLLPTELLLTVNFASEGCDQWARPAPGIDRAGTPEEAAAWIRYCNDPDDPLRRSHGYDAPFRIRYWQIGNETGYKPTPLLTGGFTAAQNAARAREFIAAMKAADPTVQLIVWGDGPNQEWEARYRGGQTSDWLEAVCDAVGDTAQMAAFHNHFGVGPKYAPLAAHLYQQDPDRTWDLLQQGVDDFEARIDYMRRSLKPFPQKLAMTEGHFVPPGREDGKLLSSWAAGVAYARCANILERNGDIIEIATLADFMGNRWQSNAVILPASNWLDTARPYLMPVGTVMALFHAHQGDTALAASAPADVDLAASRRGDTLCLHLVNLDPHHAKPLELPLPEGATADLWEIAADPTDEVSSLRPDLFEPRHRRLDAPNYTLPAAGVAALELPLA